MVIWVCEASEVNNLTVLAVGPNHRDNKNKNKIASSGSDPPMGSDNDDDDDDDDDDQSFRPYSKSTGEDRGGNEDPRQLRVQDSPRQG